MTKTQLTKSLKELHISLTNLINKLTADLEKCAKDVPGSLRIAERKNAVEFYMYDGHLKTYLGKDKQATISALADKQYKAKLLKAAMAEKRQVETCMKALSSGNGISDIDEVYKALHPAIQNLITPKKNEDDAYAAQWYEKRRRYTSQKHELNSALYTARGEAVKSKSEVIIADRLNSYGIPYIYELTFTSREDIVARYPDFTILNKRTRKEFIWEHQGSMDNPDYCLDSQYKLEWFLKRGYILGKNLIFTYEGSKRQLSTKYVDALIKEFLL